MMQFSLRSILVIMTLIALVLATLRTNPFAAGPLCVLIASWVLAKRRYPLRKTMFVVGGGAAIPFLSSVLIDGGLNALDWTTMSDAGWLAAPAAIVSLVIGLLMRIPDLPTDMTELHARNEEEG